MEREPYEFEPHSWKGKLVGRTLCVKCGLVWSSNSFTKWAIVHGCNNRDHPSYDAVRHRNGVVK